MAWIGSTQKGSFRGVAFEIESHSHDAGRRGQLHEYPLRDEPWFEDLGRKSREFSIEVFIVGDLYNLQRDALLAACEASGAGTLVHPYLGSRQVVCTGCRVSERIDEGRMCRFSLTFVEAGAQQFPAGLADFASKVDGLGSLVEAASIADFTQAYATGGLPGFVFDSVEASALSFAGKMFGFSNDSTFRSLLSSFTDDAPNLVRQPQSLATRTVELLQQSRSTSVSGARDVKGATTASANLRSLSDFSVSEQTAGISQTTSTRVAQVGNLDAFASLVRQAALASEARTIPALSFDSYDAATAYSTSFIERIDTELLSANSETAFLPLTNLAAAVSTDLKKRAGSLPQIRQVTRREHIPSLSLAYDLYGDATRAADVVARNTVRNPSFMPAGVPLEVLTA